MLNERFHGKVQLGPLKGFTLGRDPTWGAADRAPMLLGLYELEILDTLVGFSGDASTLVDIGAADGYFGVGLVGTAHYSSSFCFERDPVTRLALNETARINGVAGKIVSLGEAKETFPDEIQEKGANLADCVILCDIEGGEFELLTADVLQQLANSRLVIEMHDGLYADGDLRKKELVGRCERHFDVSFVENRGRNPCGIEILQSMHEDDKWLICSEGRGIHQTWMVLVPRQIATAH